MSQNKDIIVGGQAVLEGVMMRAPNSYAVAVRRQDGSIALKAERLPRLAEKYPILKVPVLRGSAVLLHSMLLGVKALNFSAEVAFEEEAAESKSLKAAAATGALATTAHTIESDLSFSRQAARPEEKSSSASATATAAGSIVFALLFNVLLFIVLPLLLTNVLFNSLGWGNASQITPSDAESWSLQIWGWLTAHLTPVRPSVGFNLVDGLIRMGLFVLMIFTFSRQRDVKRVFEYHGAEHKTVYAWEAGQELTVENAKRFPRQHPRCGTSFLMIVMMVSIVLFSIIKFDAILANLLVRVALIPLIAGLSYEVIKAAGAKETSPLFTFITAPGIWMQNLTTREPSAEQLEVAIYALKESLKLEPA